MSLFGMANLSPAQKTVFDLVKSDAVLAEGYFFRGDIYEARAIYQRSKSIPAEKRYQMLGRCNYLLKDYQACADAYQKFSQTSGKWDQQDRVNYAEALLVLKQYKNASAEYEKLVQQPGLTDWIQAKIWRIANLQYLYEDSIHLAVRELSINTPVAEWSGRAYADGIVFLSNRPAGEIIQRLDAATHHNFYQFYQSKEIADTLVDGWSKIFLSPKKMIAQGIPKGNTGGFCFYKNNTQLVFTASTGRKDKNGSITLGLFFASLQDGKWVTTSEFEFNSAAWSVTNPWIDANGETLYFASNSREGFGGYDLYVSRLKDSWGQPENLGSEINSPWDEQFPWWNAGSLFFASNGHAGLGGLDLYRTELQPDQEPVNLGYPINSSYDDFAISFTDSLATHGFLSSNRKHGGLDDDLFEFDMDLQTYPFTITGILKQKEHMWSDSTSLQVLSNAKITLMDHARGISLQQTTSAADGSFSITIPYFAKYTIQVTDADQVEHVASFDLPRQRKESTVHEIVLIKDIFQTITR
jgi:tetratricopeptide (TPR) repeat protein